MTNLPAVHGAHLVGSINQPTAKDTLSIVAENLGAHAARIPDGEVGERFHWILFQGAAFDATQGLGRAGAEPLMMNGFDLRRVILDGSTPAAELSFGPLGYAQAAKSSYEDFKALRNSGTIAAGTRFQVCIPSPMAPVYAYVTPEDQAAIYPAYAAAMKQELTQIAAAIPAADLSIQIDIANEFSNIEGVSVIGNPPVNWFVEGLAEGAEASVEQIIDGAAALVAELVAELPDEVELGIHLCYGDVAEKHFVEPADATHLMSMANTLSAKITRPIGFLHLPVPIERDDAAYFAPLANLSLHPETELFLGLVHHEDGLHGAAKRIAAARPALAEAGVASFGIATECGFGRGPAERTAPLLRLHAEIIEAAN